MKYVCALFTDDGDCEYGLNEGGNTAKKWFRKDCLTVRIFLFFTVLEI